MYSCNCILSGTASCKYCVNNPEREPSVSYITWTNAIPYNNIETLIAFSNEEKELMLKALDCYESMLIQFKSKDDSVIDHSLIATIKQKLLTLN